MPRVILQPDQSRRILRRRRACGGDRFDEVWNGAYVMSPPADVEHQGVAGGLTVAMHAGLSGIRGFQLFPGINVSDRPDPWRKNYRCPDIAVFLPGNPAEDRGSHWLGGPDFAVEILSRGDRSRKKLRFYADVHVRELLLVNRRPWSLELYRLLDGALRRAGTSDPETSGPIASLVLPLTFGLLPADPRPRIKVVRTDDGLCWMI